MSPHVARPLLIGLLLAPSVTPAAALSVPPVRHEVHVTSLDPAAGRLEATVDVHLAAVPDADAPWRFLLHRDLEVAAVRLGGEALPYEVAARFDPRHFWTRPPYAELEGWDLAREIAVGPPAAGWGADPPVLRVEYAGVVADSLHAPVREYGRSFETTSGRIVPEGAYLAAGTFWVPWSGSALFTFDLTVEGPAEWRTISQGALVRDEVEGDRRAMQWRCDAPSDEIYLIAGPYVVRERDHHGVTLSTWCYANTDSTISDPYLDAAAEAIDRYSALYGPYPFPKFALVENYWQTGFGMPGFTLLGDRVIRLPFIVHTSYPHEILHNWWGNGVYVEAEQGNWCEGLTTYGADYAAKEAEGGTAARDYRRDALVGYRDFAAAGGKDFPLVRFRERDSAATQAVGYGKTLMVFHMLRRGVGDDVFHASLRRLFETHRFRRAGWDDVREAFEAETGRDLGAWFEQWVKRPGAPALSLEDVGVVDANGRRFVHGTLVQEPPVFALRVPMVVSADDRRIETVVEAREERTPFELEVDFTPERLAADPEFQIFRRLHDAEVAPTLSGVLGAKAVRVLVGAEAAGSLREALLEVARDWARDTSVVVVEEVAGEAPEDFDGGTWFLGDGPAARAFAARDLPDARDPAPTWVAAGRLDGRADRPAALLRCADASSLPSIARKVPHYSKYSWLAFEGDRNVGKGVWDPGESPLAIRLADAKGGSR